MDNKQKAKRKLKGFDFAKDGAAVALVGPSVGGPANGIPTLIAKANNFSPEFIKKMQQVQVTMELPAFLEKFFGIWGSDAEVLARLMGYEKPEDEDEDEGDWWENYIEEKLSAFTIIKSLHEAKNLPEALSKLTEQDYLDVLNDQVLIEKALKEFDEKSDTSAKTVEPKVEASASKVIKNKKEKQMTDMVEKEKLTAVEKALSEQKVELEKALEEKVELEKALKQFEEEKKQAVVKSKTDAVNAVVKDEKQAAVVLKAALALDSKEDFDALVEVFKSMNTLIEKGALFQEQGGDASPEDEVGKKTALQKALENKYKANQQ